MEEKKQFHLIDGINNLTQISYAMESIHISGTNNMGTFFNCMTLLNETINKLIELNTKNSDSQSEGSD